ncbi:hypothetical protein INT43_001439 [Umbelopsis isabellina]|uniref:Heterokaryon incompatibility domain-containing protein n=1 Tax=Mortierella isabellina TaxID=91625 RepID=A0A8H7PDN0_MORIS|nr:hypothetical protein INT43_001439 [Umbelopsis isabellina]
MLNEVKKFVEDEVTSYLKVVGYKDRDSDMHRLQGLTRFLWSAYSSIKITRPSNKRRANKCQFKELFPTKFREADFQPEKNKLSSDATRVHIVVYQALGRFRSFGHLEASEMANALCLNTIVLAILKVLGDISIPHKSVRPPQIWAGRYEEVCLTWEEVKRIWDEKNNWTYYERIQYALVSMSSSSYESHWVVATREGFKLIKREDVKCASSWVWTDSYMYPERILDQVRTANRLGYDHIWIDCFAVREQQPEKSVDQRCMADVYIKSAVIVSFGCQDQRKIRILKRLFGKHSPVHLLATRWNTRVWTFQEAWLPPEVYYTLDGQEFKLPRHESEIAVPPVSDFSEYRRNKEMNLVEARFRTAHRVSTKQRDYFIGIAAMVPEVTPTSQNIEGFTIQPATYTLPREILLMTGEGYGVKDFCWLPRFKILSTSNKLSGNKVSIVNGVLQVIPHMVFKKGDVRCFWTKRELKPEDESNLQKIIRSVKRSTHLLTIEKSYRYHLTYICEEQPSDSAKMTKLRVIYQAYLAYFADSGMKGSETYQLI